MKSILLAIAILPLFAQEAAKPPEVHRPSDASTSAYWKIKSSINEINVNYLQSMQNLENQLKAAVQIMDADCVKSGTGLDNSALQASNTVCLPKEDKKKEATKETKNGE